MTRGPKTQFPIIIHVAISIEMSQYIAELQSAHQISQSKAVRRVLDYAATQRLFLPDVSTDSKITASGNDG